MKFAPIPALIAFPAAAHEAGAVAHAHPHGVEALAAVAIAVAIAAALLWRARKG